MAISPFSYINYTIAPFLPCVNEEKMELPDFQTFPELKQAVQISSKILVEKHEF